MIRIRFTASQAKIVHAAGITLAYGAFDYFVAHQDQPLAALVKGAFWAGVVAALGWWIRQAPRPQ